MTRKRPTRTDLLRVLARLQDLIGTAKGLHDNDRDPVGFENAQRRLEEAFNLAIEAQGFDDPVDTTTSTNGWNFPAAGGRSYYETPTSET